MPNSRTSPSQIAAFTVLLCSVIGHAAADTTSPAGNAENGKKLHAAHCVECHDSTVYTRKNRRVDSLSALSAQVKACAHLPKQPLTPEQVADVIAYLNETYYRFK